MQQRQQQHQHQQRTIPQEQINAMINQPQSSQNNTVQQQQQQQGTGITMNNNIMNMHYQMQQRE